MRNLNIALNCLQCTTVTPESIHQVVRLLIEDNFELLQFVENQARPVGLSEINFMLDRYLSVRERDKKTNHPIRWRLSFRSHPSDMKDLIGVFEFDQFNARTNRLRLAALIDFEFINQGAYIEPFTDRLLHIAIKLHEIVKPVYSFIDDDDKNLMDAKKAAQLHLPSVGWVNIFSKLYIDKLGESLVFEMPGYMNRKLESGSVFYQISERFVVDEVKQAHTIRRNIAAYFLRHQMKVKCLAPYVLDRAIERIP